MLRRVLQSGEVSVVPVLCRVLQSGEVFVAPVLCRVLQSGEVFINCRPVLCRVLQSDDDADQWPAAAARRPLLGGTALRPVPVRHSSRLSVCVLTGFAPARVQTLHSQSPTAMHWHLSSHSHPTSQPLL